MSSFNKTIGKWVFTVNEMEEAVMYEFGKREEFCAGTIEDVIGGWVEEALPRFRLNSVYHILAIACNGGAKYTLKAARSKTPSDRRGTSRAVLRVLGIDWEDKDADAKCAEIDVQERLVVEKTDQTEDQKSSG